PPPLHRGRRRPCPRVARRDPPGRAGAVAARVHGPQRPGRHGRRLSVRRRPDGGRAGRRRPSRPSALVTRLPEPERQPARAVARARHRRRAEATRGERRAPGGRGADRLRLRSRRAPVRPRRRGARDRERARPCPAPRCGGERSPGVRRDARRLGAGHPVKLVVVGGGITGVAAAYRALEVARERGIALELTLVEARDRPGGTIGTERTGGFLVEAGPDSFLSEKPWALDLCRRLGVEDRLARCHAGLPTTRAWARSCDDGSAGRRSSASPSRSSPASTPPTLTT